MQNIPITNEQEAAVAILFASVMAGSKPMNQSQIEQLSRMLVLSSKFKSSSLNDLTVKALSLQAEHGSKVLIEHCAPLILDDFKETLFAMCCELMTGDGKIDENESIGGVLCFLCDQQQNRCSSSVASHSCAFSTTWSQQQCHISEIWHCSKVYLWFKKFTQAARPLKTICLNNFN